MKESARNFGPGNILAGVITPPARTEGRRLGAVFVNSGLIHHIGPYRAYVELARRLAGLGFTVLRFDLSGIGDSRARADNLSAAERSHLDITAAIDLLAEKYSVDEVVLIGLCSGADNAHRTALRDPRVTGLISMDGYGYRTMGFYVRRLPHYVRRMLSLKKWRDLLARTFSGFVTRSAVSTWSGFSGLTTAAIGGPDSSGPGPVTASGLAEPPQPRTSAVGTAS